MFGGTNNKSQAQAINSQFSKMTLSESSRVFNSNNLNLKSVKSDEDTNQNIHRAEKENHPIFSYPFNNVEQSKNDNTNG
jgi:hypothetical protein